MKKLILTTCLMAGAALASFGAVQYNFYNNGVGNGMQSTLSITFTESGYYGIETLFGGPPRPSYNYGYYMVVSASDPTPTGVAGSGNSEGWLGYFNAGDTIGLWTTFYWDGIIISAYNGNYKDYRELSQLVNPGGWPFPYLSDTYLLEDGAFNAIHGQFRFKAGTPPAGEPLPGVMAALAIGGCAFLGRKLKNRAKR